MTVAVPLIARLAERLQQESVRYCHWKSNAALDRSLTADNDLDLLVARSDAAAFRGCLHDLGFRLARPAPARQVPGVIDYYGYDASVDRVVHVHAHHQLVVGDDLTKNYRLPLEGAYLASSTDSDTPLPVPSAELEYLLLVLRLTLKHCPWDAQLALKGRPTRSERAELAHLEARIDEGRLLELARRSLPFVDGELFDECRRACAAGSSAVRRAAAGHRLHRALAAHGRRSPTADTATKLARRLGSTIRHPASGKRPDTGGLLVAVVGADGSGKSTAVGVLAELLGRDFDVRRTHLGKPPRSLVSRSLRRALQPARDRGCFVALRDHSGTPPARFPGLIYCAWHLAIARDRAKEHRRTRRAVGAGSITICDRFPVAGLRTMDSPRCRDLPGLSDHPVARWFARRELRYYQEISPPDLLLVLRVDPAEAVRRRPEQAADFVRRRAEEVWRHDWSGDGTVVIDAGRPLADVLDDVRAAVWKCL